MAFRRTGISYALPRVTIHADNLHYRFGLRISYSSKELLQSISCLWKSLRSLSRRYLTNCDGSLHLVGGTGADGAGIIFTNVLILLMEAGGTPILRS